MDAARGPAPTVPARARPLDPGGAASSGGPPPERAAYPWPVPSSAEDWPSGLRRTIGNRVGVTPSRVRIPYPPPADHDAGSTTGGPGVRVRGPTGVRRGRPFRRRRGRGIVSDRADEPDAPPPLQFRRLGHESGAADARRPRRRGPRRRRPRDRAGLRRDDGRAGRAGAPADGGGG